MHPDSGVSASAILSGLYELYVSRGYRYDQAVKKLVYRGLADLKQRFGPLKEQEK